MIIFSPGIYPSKYTKENDWKEIVEETKDYISRAEELIKFFENTDDYEIHQLGEEINTEAAEISPAYFTEKDELLFASSRGSSGSNERFKIYLWKIWIA